MDAHARFVIDKVRHESRGALTVAFELKPIKHRRRVRLDVLGRRMGTHALADDNVLQAVAVEIGHRQRVRLGETDAEVREAMQDLRAVGCDILTVGQYLQQTQKHLNVENFVPPEQFDAWRVFGESLGFLQVVASPLTRSSYHAEQVRDLMKLYPRQQF